MKIFYIENENGNYFSENKRRRFIRLTGKKAYEYIHNHKGICFEKTTTDEEDGDEIYVEVSKEKVKKVRAEKDHKKYLRKQKEISKIEVIPLIQFDEDGEEQSVEETISYPFECVEDEAIHEIELEILREGLKNLSKREYHVIFSLFLAKVTVSEKQLAESMGVTQQYISRLKIQSINKLKEFFEIWL